jgi:hypothetical protein
MRVQPFIISREVDLFECIADLRAGGLVLAEVRLQLVAPGDDAEQPVRSQQVAVGTGVELVEVAAHLVDRLERRRALHADHVAFHEPPGHQRGGIRHLLLAQAERRVEPRLELVALHVGRDQRVDVLPDLLLHPFSGSGVERHHVRRLPLGDHLQGLWWGQDPCAAALAVGFGHGGFLDG